MPEFRAGKRMDSQLTTLPIRSRRSSFDAAARCLSLGPLLRRGGVYCIVIGAVAVLVLGAWHTPAGSPVLWAYVAVVALGIYLLSPAPQPWALPAAGLVILAVLARFWVFDYRIWRATHVAPNLDPIGSILEIFVAVTLLASYVGYERGRGETDGTTLRELRSLARAVFRADPRQDSEVTELRCRGHLAQLCRVDGLVLMVIGRHSAWAIRSRVGRVVILDPKEIELRVLAAPKTRGGLKIRMQVSRLPELARRNWTMPPSFTERLTAMGVSVTGLGAQAAAAR